MKILHFWLLAITLLSAHSVVQAEGFYKWKDARGNIQYGDQPPPNSKAEKVAMPAITVIDNYADQWKPIGSFEGVSRSTIVMTEDLATAIWAAAATPMLDSSMQPIMQLTS